MPRGSWTLRPEQYIILQADQGEEDITVNAYDLIERLTKSIELADPEVQTDCYVQLKAHSDLDCEGNTIGSSILTFRIPSTAAQKRLHQEMEEKKAQREKEETEKKERELLAQLKAKYEPNN